MYLYIFSAGKKEESSSISVYNAARCSWSVATGSGSGPTGNSKPGRGSVVENKG